MIIDTHSHIYLNKNNSQSEILNGLSENMAYIISIGVDLDSSQICIDLAKKDNRVFATIGIHPEYVENLNLENTLNSLEKMLLENIDFIKGIGEIGFDFYQVSEEKLSQTKEIQEKFFKGQIYLAMKYNLPIVIHSRDSSDDILRVLKETNCKKFIIHCFSQDIDFAKKCLELSSECMFSFSGIVTYKSALSIQNAASLIPLENILIETDCPFLSPQIVRGTENIPNNVIYNLEKIQSLRTESKQEIENQIYKNSLKIFNL